MSDDDIAALEAEIDAEERQQHDARSSLSANSKKRPQRPAPPLPSSASPRRSSSSRPSTAPSHGREYSDAALVADDDFDDPYDKIDFKKIAAMTAAAQLSRPDGDGDDVEGMSAVDDDAVDADLRALMREIHAEGGDDSHSDDAGGDDEDDELARLERESDLESKQQPPPRPFPTASPTSAARRAAERSQAERETQKRLQVETAPPQSFAPPPSPTREQTLASLQRQLEASRRRALEYHRAGKKEEALEVMKSVRTLQARIQQMDAAQQQQPTSLSSPPSPSSTTSNSSTSSSSSSATVDPSDLLTLLRHRLIEYQRAAIAHKQANRLDRAKTLLLDIRRMKGAIEEAQQGRPLTTADIPPPLDPLTQQPKLSRQSSGSGSARALPVSAPPSPAPMPPPRPPSLPRVPSFTGPPPLPPRSPVSRAGLTTKQSLQYATLIQSLSGQAEELHQQMTELLAAAAVAASHPSVPTSSTSTTERTYKLLALQYHRLHKRTKADLDLLHAAQARAIPPPSYHTAEEKLTRIHENADVRDDQLLVLLHSSRDLTDALYSVTVQWEGGAQPLYYTSGALKGPAMEWKGKWVCTVGARSKAMVKTVSRSRLVLILHRQRMIMGSVEVGRGEMRLKDLLTRCEKKEAVKIKDAEGKRVGEVTVEARLRRPLERMEVREATRQLLVVDEFEQPLQPAPSASAVTTPRGSVVQPPPVPVLSASPVHARSSSHPGLSQSTAAPSASPSLSSTATSPPPTSAYPVVPVAPLPPGLTEDDLADPHSVLSILSNDVLEWEINTRVPLLLQLARQRSDAAAVEDLSDRLTSLQTQLQILVTAVQAGKLQLDDYLAKLRESIERGQALAKELMRRSRKDDAKVVIQRVQLMRNEVKTAEDNADDLA